MDIDALIDEIEQTRKRQGISVRLLCMKAGISKKTYYTWLSGKATPNLSAMSYVLDTMHLTLILTRCETARNGG